MKPSVIVAVAVMTLIVVVSLVKSKKTSSEVTEILQSLLNFAEKNGGLITQYDYLTNLAIGFSPSDFQFFVLKIVNEKRVFTQVNLKEIEKVTLSKGKRRSSNGDDVIDTILLNFQKKDKAKHVIGVELYNLESDGFTFYGELAIAEKWQKIITDQIANGKA